MIRYDRLWKTMEDKKFTQYRLIKQHGFSAGQIGRLKKNMHVSTHTIDILCTILQCDVNDIMEFCPEGGSWPEAPAMEAQVVAASGDEAPESTEKAKAVKEKKAEKAGKGSPKKAAKETPKKIDKAEKTDKSDKTAAKKTDKPKAVKEKKAEKAKKEKGEKKGKGGKKK